jgi:hypothetical protein
VIGGWVAAGVAAIVSGAQTVAIWTLYKIEAIKGAAVFMVNIARIVAGWVLMGAQALLGAAKVALAWVIAMGPIALVIAAVVALVVVIVKNWDTIKNATVAAWNATVGFVKGAWDKIKSAVSTAISAVVGFIKAHWGLLVSIIGGPLAAVVVLVIKHWDKIKSVVSTGVTKVIDTVKALPGKIKGFFADAGNWLLNAGKEIITGLIRGITSKISAIGDAMGKVASKIKGFLPGSPVREGPLRSWNNGGAGKRLVGLLADGLSDTAPVDRAMRGLSSTLAMPALSVPASPSIGAGGGGRTTVIPVNVDGKTLFTLMVDHTTRTVRQTGTNPLVTA